jgi:hypothetical protein
MKMKTFDLVPQMNQVSYPWQILDQLQMEATFHHTKCLLDGKHTVFMRLWNGNCKRYSDDVITKVTVVRKGD